MDNTITNAAYLIEKAKSDTLCLNELQKKKKNTIDSLHDKVSVYVRFFI